MMTMRTRTSPPRLRRSRNLVAVGSPQVLVTVGPSQPSRSRKKPSTMTTAMPEQRLRSPEKSLSMEPRLLQKIGLQEGQMEQVAAQLRTLLDQVSRAKDAALNALSAHGATSAPEAATAETTESAARLTAEGAGSETATEQ